MKSTYRTFFLVLILGMPLGYNPVTDTLSKAFNVDFLVGRSDYYTGCNSPATTIDFQEVHGGYKVETSQRVSFHVDGGLVPTDVHSVEGYQGGKATFGYLVGGTDVDWNRGGIRNWRRQHQAILRPISSTWPQAHLVCRCRNISQVSTGIIRCR